MTCPHCKRNDHDARAHTDPVAALEAGDEALANGDRNAALVLYYLSAKLSRKRARELRGLRG